VQLSMDDSLENRHSHVILEESRVIGTTKDLRVAGSFLTVDLPHPEILRPPPADSRMTGRKLFSSFMVLSTTEYGDSPENSIPFVFARHGVPKQSLLLYKWFQL